MHGYIEISNIKHLKQYIDTDSMRQTILTGEVAPWHGTYIAKLFKSGEPMCAGRSYQKNDDLVRIRRLVHNNVIGNQKMNAQGDLFDETKADELSWSCSMP